MKAIFITFYLQEAEFQTKCVQVMLRFSRVTYCIWALYSSI